MFLLHDSLLFSAGHLGTDQSTDANRFAAQGILTTKGVAAAIARHGTVVAKGDGRAGVSYNSHYSLVAVVETSDIPRSLAQAVGLTT